MKTTDLVNSTDGSFSIPLAVGTEISQNIFNIYSTVEKNSIQNKTASVITDRFKIIHMSADDYRRNVGTSATISVTIHYEYDDRAVTTGYFTLNDLPLVHKGSGIWQTTDNKTKVQDYTYNFIEGFGDTYGLNTINMNQQNITVIWDQLGQMGS